MAVVMVIQIRTTHYSVWVTCDAKENCSYKRCQRRHTYLQMYATTRHHAIGQLKIVFKESGSRQLYEKRSFSQSIS